MLNVIPAQVLRSGLLCALSVLAVLPASAASRSVAAGGDLQGALNQAQGGDVITIAAGATFQGHFRLPANNSGQWITIQSSAMSSLPGNGNRVSPSQAQYMPKLVTPDASPALTIPGGANYYRIQGIEFTVNSGVYVLDLVQAGTGGETAVSQLPHDIDFDRDYIHGDPVSGGKRGLALNSATTTVENSYFAAFTSTGQDTQAICGWNGTGPFTIANNHLEAGTEIVAFGGAPPAISGLIPSNITIQGNEFYKPTKYYTGSSDYAGIQVWAKNHIELKNAQNVTISNNTFTNNFKQADQLGFTLVLNVRDEGGQVPWATVSNVTVANNTFQHVAAGVLLMGHDGDGGGTAGGFTFSNNLWVDMGAFGGDGRMYEILNGVRGANIDHDSAFPKAWLLVFAQGASSGINVTNSIYSSGWGIAGDGSAAGEPTMVAYNSDGSFRNNAVIGANASQYTGSHFANLIFTDWNQIGFVDPNSNWSLLPTSPLHGMATDGKDLGDTALPGSSTTPTQPLPPAPPSSTIPTGWVNIVSKNSGKCLDVPSSSTSGGTALVQWTCGGTSNQKFQLVSVSGGYKIINQNSGLGLDINGASTNPGAKLIQWPYAGDTNEVFTVTSLGDGSFTIQPNHSGQYLDVAGASKKDGGPVLQWTSTGSANQQWTLVSVQ
jgi:Ricin-type beta-trefoil lectin domain-like/Right handed beta helix region